jgi:osmoprotectant transport system ATP-binding protein
MLDYAIELRGVCKKFSGAVTYSVRDVNLKLKRNSLTAIVGSSGSGKTTLLKMVNRIYEPTSGEIIFEGENVNGLKVEDYRKKIGYVIQQIGLFPHMTVAQNIATVPRSLKWERRKIDERVDFLLDLVHLPHSEYRHRYPSQLSGGQQQRVGIARAMAAEPEIMLMDEPFGAIDSITRKILQDELLSIQKNLAKTILFVTHDIHEAFKLGDNVVIMNEGKILQHDTPFNIIFHPADKYIASLASSEDILEKLRMLKAEAIMERKTDSDAPALIRAERSASLSSVLGKFMETGRDSLDVYVSDGEVCGVIRWDRFKSISELKCGANADG